MNSPARTSIISRLAIFSAFVALAALFSFSAVNATAKTKKQVAAVNSCPSAIAAVNRTVKRVAIRKVEVKYAPTANRKKRAKSQLKKARNGAAAARAAVRKYCGPVSGLTAWSGPCFQAIDAYTRSTDRAVSTKLSGKRAKKGKKLSKKQIRRRTKTLRLLNAKMKSDLKILQTACAKKDEGGNGGGNGGGGTPPGTVVITGPTTPVKDNPVIVITPSNPAAKLECKLDGGAFAVVTSPYTLDISALAEGVHTVTCHSVVDGVNGPDSTYTFTIDRTAPTTNVSVASPTNDSTPPVSLSASEAGVTFECKINGGAYAPQAANFDMSALNVGDNTLTCRATDAAGNVGPATDKTVVYDADAPGLTMTGPDGAIKINNPSYAVSSTDDAAVITCSVDGGSSSVVANPGSYQPTLSDGVHSITCVSTDAANNTSSQTYNVTVDTIAPGFVLDGPSGPTKDDTPTYTPTSTDPSATIECSLDGGSATAAASGVAITLAHLDDGAHTISCTATDAAGNSTTDAKSITVDSSAPGLTVTGPAGDSNNPNPTYVPTTTDGTAVIKCDLNGGVAVTVASGADYNPGPLAQGTHTITCVATDPAGNATTTTKTITVDTDAPTLTMTGPTGVTMDSTPDYVVTTTDATAVIKCSVDGGAQTTVASGGTYSPSVTPGVHNVTCVSTDAAGNATPITKAIIAGSAYTDPVTKINNGGLGLACTPLDFLLPLGCPSGLLTHTIPAYPNGLTGNYTVDLTGSVTGICSLAGVFTSYTMNITVDGTSVASDNDGSLIQIFCFGGVNVSAQKLNLSLSASTSHTIKLTLSSDWLQLSVLPSYDQATLTVDIDQL